MYTYQLIPHNSRPGRLNFHLKGPRDRSRLPGHQEDIVYAARPTIYTRAGTSGNGGTLIMHRLSLDCFLLAASTKQKGEMLVIVTYEAKIILSAAIVQIGEFNPDVLTNRLKSIPSFALKRRRTVRHRVGVFAKSKTIVLKLFISRREKEREKEKK